MFYPRDLILLRTVGEGSFGRVIKVWVKNALGIQKHCALKMIRSEVLQDKDYVESLFNEIEIFRELNGEIFFPRLHSTFYAVNRLCILTDFCEGGEILSLIHRLNGFTSEQIQFYGAEILLALKCLHDRNILYRDLKSENVLLTKDGHIRLVDFGLSVKTDREIRGRVGTTECMAPEVVKEELYGIGADLWSLGILLYEMYFKETPFADDTPDAIEYKILNSEINYDGINDHNLRDLIGGLLEKNQKKRLGFKNGVLEIMNHPFFNGVDWMNIKNMNTKAPINCEILSRGENYPHYRESVFTLMHY